MAKRPVSVPGGNAASVRKGAVTVYLKLINGMGENIEAKHVLWTTNIKEATVFKSAGDAGRMCTVAKKLKQPFTE